MKSILVASDDGSAVQVIKACLSGEYVVHGTSRADAVLEMLRRQRYEFIFIDVAMLGATCSTGGYKDALRPFWQLHPTIEVIVMVPPEMTREAVMAVKAGAGNYLTLPLSVHEVQFLVESINEAIIMQSELDYLRDQAWQTDSLEIVQTRSPLMRRVFDKIRSVAPTRSTVLLMGETGTGKNVLARLIHRHSVRKDAQFIGLHCGAVPETLLESELFGHEKGAFTGAVRRKLGKFEIAHGGTMFLDEIGTVTPAAQIKLLQVLQDGTFQRVGGDATLETDVRIISASNIDLKGMCDNNEFRKDLFYRLNVFPIQLPSLRERKEDIPLLVEVLLRRLNKKFQKNLLDVHPHVITAFEHYPWPGNIRELENLIERAHILESSPVLTPDSFPQELFDNLGPADELSGETLPTLTQWRRTALDALEKRYLADVLSRNGGSIKASAESAGIGTRQLHKLMKRHGLRKEDFKGEEMVS